MDSSGIYVRGEKVADSSHADQADSATSAGDVDTLDGKDSTDFQASNPCPSGTMFHEGTCIEKVGHGGPATFANAQSICLNEERRLPTVAELQTFRNRLGHDFTGTEYTSQVWTESDDTGQHQMVMQVGQIGAQSPVRADEASAAFRCMASPNLATPDSTTLESIAQADLRDAATAATTCAANNGGSYTFCASAAQLTSYGYEQDGNVTYTNVAATSTYWMARVRNVEGGRAFEYDTATGEIVPVP